MSIVLSNPAILPALERNISQWLETARQEITPERISSSVHIDELIDITMLPDDTIELSLIAFEALIERLSTDVNLYMPELRVVLTDSNELDTALPVFSELGSQLSSQPPSLYIVSWDSNRCPRKFESYKCPHPAGLKFGRYGNDIYVYYHSWRRMSTHDATDEEYSRELIADYYPHWFPCG